MTLELRRILGPTIRLSADAEGSDPHPIWIQAAVEGTWKGHAAFDLVEFTESLFDQVIANFRKNPAYKAGDDGIGSKRVVRLDYEHTSEMDFTGSNVAQEGLPAPGWIFELEKRSGDDGKVELWALVLPNKKLWSQIENDEYVWTSVAIDPNARDRVTDRLIGPELTSLAITNNPFIQGMQEMSHDSTESRPLMSAGFGLHGYCLMTDSTNKGQPVLFAMSTYGEAESPAELLVSLRGRFGLSPEASASEVLLEVEHFRRLKDTGELPAEVDDGGKWVVSSLRETLGMKLLSTEEEIFTKIREVLQPLVEKESNPDGGNQPPAVQSPAAEGSAAQNIPENQSMSAQTLTARLAKPLKLTANATDDDVVDAIKQEQANAKLFLTRVAKALGVRIKLSDAEDEDKVVAAVEQAAGDAASAEDAEEAVSAIKKMVDILDADDFTEALSKATKLTEEVAKFGPMVEELNQLKAKMADDEVEDAEEQIEKIAACHKVDDRTKRLLLTQVIDEKEVDGKKIRSVNSKGLEQIKKDWPVEDDSQGKALMTKGVFADKGGVQKGGAVTNAPNIETAPVIRQESGGDPTVEEKQKEILTFTGRNDVEKTMSYLAEKETVKFSAVPQNMQVFVASRYFKTGEFPQL